MRFFKTKHKGLTNKQSYVLSRIEHRLDVCLNKYDENKEMGREHLLRLILASSLRGVQNTQDLRSTKINSEDARAVVAQKVSQKYVRYAKVMKKEQTDFLSGILEFLGGERQKYKQQ